MGVPLTYTYTLVNNTLADATQVMQNFNDAKTALNNNAAASGVNSDITALNALSTPLTPAQGGSAAYVATGTVTGTNTIAFTGTTPANYALVATNKVIFKAAGTNTGATSLNVNGTGALAVVRESPSGPQTLTGGEIVSGCFVEVIYDAATSSYQLVTVQNAVGGFGPLTSIAAAATTDLGSVPSHNIQITGAATITSFGSSASTTYPIYRGIFSGVNTLTQSGTLSLPAGGVNITTAAGDTMVALFLGGSSWQVVDYQKANGQAVVPATLATKQVLTSGTSLTYTTPANCRQLFIRMVGGGGSGGGSSGQSSGSTGGTTTFSTINAIGGGGGGVGSSASGGPGGAGGTGGTGSGVSTVRIAGGDGSPSSGSVLSAQAINHCGGSGGNSPFGGGGAGANIASPSAGKTNSGGGGGGNGASNSSSTLAGGGGGGAGEYVEFYLNAPAASYTYTVGAAGAAVSAAAGGSGIIIVEERY
jgi:hypothetical protein